MSERQEENLDPTAQISTYNIHQNMFEGYYFFFYNYGHKVAFCNKFSRRINDHNSYEKPRYDNERRNDRTSQNGMSNSYNRFDTLRYETECYKCNNFGHVSRNYPMNFQRFSGSTYTN